MCYAHSVVISYSPTEHGIEGIVAIAARADGVRLYFGQGVQAADPKGLLQGTGLEWKFRPQARAPSSRRRMRGVRPREGKPRLFLQSGGDGDGRAEELHHRVSQPHDRANDESDRCQRQRPKGSPRLRLPWLIRQ